MDELDKALEICVSGPVRERALERFKAQLGEWGLAMPAVEPLVLQPGETLRVEVTKPHRFTGRGPALILEVSKPCVVDDNYFADPRIPIGGNYRGRTDRAGQGTGRDAEET